MTKVTFKSKSERLVKYKTGRDTEPGQFFFGYHVFGNPACELMYNYGNGIALIQRGTYVIEKESIRVIQILDEVIIDYKPEF